MDNWLLIIVATVFLICIAVGYIRGFLKFGLSLISTVLTLVIVAFLSPYVADALAKYTPVDDFIEQKFVAAFMPELSEEQLANLDLSGTPLENLSQEQLANLNEMDWDRLGITVQDVLGVVGEIPRDIQISQIENAPMPEFIKDMLMDNNNESVYSSLGVSSFPQYVASYISRMALNILSFGCDDDVCRAFAAGIVGHERDGDGLFTRFAAVLAERNPFWPCGLFASSGGFYNGGRPCCRGLERKTSGQLVGREALLLQTFIG